MHSKVFQKGKYIFLSSKTQLQWKKTKQNKQIILFKENQFDALNKVEFNGAHG